MRTTCQLVASVLHAQTQDAPIPGTATHQAMLADEAEEGLSHGHPGLPSMAPLPAPKFCQWENQTQVSGDLPGL